MTNIKYFVQLSCIYFIIAIADSTSVLQDINNHGFKSSYDNLSYQSETTSKIIRACKKQSNDIRLTLNVKIHYVNTLPDKLIVYPLTEKYVSKYFIYKNLEDVNAKKPYYSWSISKYFGFRLNKPIANMGAIELFSLFTLLGPGGKYEDNIEYELEVPSVKIFELDQNNCYLKTYFDIPVPDEVEDIVNERLSFISPIIVHNVVTEPIVIEKKDFFLLQPCS